MRRLFLILLLVPIGASSQDLSPKIQDILRITLASDGYLTEETHREFWEEANKIGTPEEMKVATELIQGSIILASEYQTEAWSSAKESATKRTVIKSKRLIELEDEYPRKHKESMIKVLPYSQHEPAVKAFDNQFATVRKNTSNLLEASANGASMLSVQGERTQVIDLNLINTSLTAIESSFERVTNLLDPDWKKSSDELTENLIYLIGYKLPFMAVKTWQKSEVTSTTPSMTLILDKATKMATKDGKPYLMYESDQTFKLVSSKTGFISATEKDPFYLDRTSLILSKLLKKYQMEMVDIDTFEMVSQQIKIDAERAKKRKKEDEDRKLQEKLDARKL